MYINRLIFSVELILILDSSFSVSSFSSLIHLPYRNMYTMTVKNLHTYLPNDSSRLTILSMKGRPPPEKRELSTLWTSENYGPLTEPYQQVSDTGREFIFQGNKVLGFNSWLKPHTNLQTWRFFIYLYRKFVCLQLNLFQNNW